MLIGATEDVAYRHESNSRREPGRAYDEARSAASSTWKALTLPRRSLLHRIRRVARERRSLCWYHSEECVPRSGGQTRTARKYGSAHCTAVFEPRMAWMHCAPCILYHHCNYGRSSDRRRWGPMHCNRDEFCRERSVHGCKTALSDP